MEDAVSDFVVWEPGETVVCILCNRQRGGDNPPGNWQREYDTNRRRVPIYGERIFPWSPPLGFMEWTQE